MISLYTPDCTPYFLAPLSDDNKATLILLHDAENNEVAATSANTDKYITRLPTDRGSDPITSSFCWTSEKVNAIFTALLPTCLQPETFTYNTRSSDITNHSIDGYVIKSRFYYLVRDCFKVYDLSQQKYFLTQGIGYRRCYIDQEVCYTNYNQIENSGYIIGYTHGKAETCACLGKRGEVKPNEFIEIYLFLEGYPKYKNLILYDNLKVLMMWLGSYSTIEKEAICNVLPYFYATFIRSSGLQSNPGCVNLIHGDNVWTASWGNKEIFNLIFSPDMEEGNPQAAQKEFLCDYEGLRIYHRNKKAQDLLILGSEEILEKMTVDPVLDLLNELCIQDTKKLTPVEIAADFLASLANYSISAKVMFIPLSKTQQEEFKSEYISRSGTIHQLMKNSLLFDEQAYAQTPLSSPNLYNINPTLIDNLTNQIRKNSNQTVRESQYIHYVPALIKDFLKKGGVIEYLDGLSSTKSVLSLSRDQKIYVGCSQGMNRSRTLAALLLCKGFNVEGVLAGDAMDLLSTNKHAFEVNNNILAQPPSEEENQIFIDLFKRNKPPATHPPIDSRGYEKRSFYLNLFKKIAVEARRDSQPVTFLCYGSSANAVLMHLLELGLKDYSLFRIVFIGLGDTILHPGDDPRYSDPSECPIKGMSKEAYAQFISLNEKIILFLS